MKLIPVKKEVVEANQPQKLVGITVLILAFPFLFMPQETKNIEKENTEEKPVIKKELSDSMKMFSDVIAYLKFREGYEPIAKPCPAGFLTVGYGHNLRASGKKIRALSEPAAAKLLVEDFDKHLKEVNKYFPNKPYHEKLAITCLVMNTGVGKVKNKNIWRRMKAGKTPNFESYVIYFKPSGRKVTSSHLKQSRAFEKALYTQEPQFFPFYEKGKHWQREMSAEEMAKYYRKELKKRRV